MIDFGPEDPASTPLAREEQQGLLLSYITTLGELNEAEQANILKAKEKARKRAFVLDQPYLDRLHSEMFDEVWRWAGTHRTTNKTLGIDFYRIPTELRAFIEQFQYWMTNKTYAPDEFAARFHHKLVWIHPYPNGNGRHSRLAADLLLESLGEKPFTWGAASGADKQTIRHQYKQALEAADAHDYTLLFTLVRS